MRVVALRLLAGANPHSLRHVGSQLDGVDRIQLLELCGRGVVGKVGAAVGHHQQEGTVVVRVLPDVLPGIPGLGVGVVPLPLALGRVVARVVVGSVVLVGALQHLPVVEALAALLGDVGVAAVTVEVPLADVRRLVPGRREDLAHAQLFVGQVEVVQEHPRTEGIAPGHEGGAIGRADGADADRVGEVDALGGQGVQAGRLHVGIAGVPGGLRSPLVGQHEDDVGPGPSPFLYREGPACRDDDGRQCCGEEKELLSRRRVHVRPHSVLERPSCGLETDAVREHL